MQTVAIAPEPVFLNKNESPFPPLVPVIRRMREMAGRLNRYGEFKPQLPDAVAEFLGVAANCVVVGNGSSDLLYGIARVALRPGDRVALPDLSFGFYDVVMNNLGAQVVKVPAVGLEHDLEGLVRAARDGARLVLACTPNNPTGKLIAPDRLQWLIDSVPPSTVLLIDEAYGEFLPPSSRLDTARIASEREHIITLRTLSKLHGLAGLRVGYAVGNPVFMAQITRMQPAFHISILAQVAAAESLRHPRLLEQRRRFFEQERSHIVNGLDRLGVPYAPPSANFYMVDFGTTSEAAALEFERQNVFVTTTRIGGYVRVSIGTREQNDAFLRAAAAILGRPSPVEEGAAVG
ncbi:MAG: pyridoxal phosphate-dependent aminotransferase [Dehalococcoidia bacterium]